MTIALFIMEKLIQTTTTVASVERPSLTVGFKIRVLSLDVVNSLILRLPIQESTIKVIALIQKTTETG